MSLLLNRHATSHVLVVLSPDEMQRNASEIFPHSQPHGRDGGLNDFEGNSVPNLANVRICGLLNLPRRFVEPLRKTEDTNMRQFLSAHC